MIAQISTVDFSSITLVVQVLALVAVFFLIYAYKVLRDKNKDVVELHRLARKDDVAALIARSKDIVSIPNGLTNEQTYELVTIQIKKKHNQYVIKALILALFIILFFSCLMLLIVIPDYFKEKLSNETSQLDVQFTSDVPTIIGIYPNDVFGVNQKSGLQAAVKYSNLPVRILNLDFLSAKEMKEGQVARLLDSLEKAIDTRNILAIVGPSITECTTEVLKVVNRKGKKFPVFVTSAASETYLDWTTLRQNLNLFRTGTGIDTRANLIASALKGKNFRHKSLLLVEKKPGGAQTFGELYLQELRKSEVLNAEISDSNDDTRNIWVVNYDPDTARVDDFDATVEEHLHKFNYVFVLGVGPHFSRIIDRHYRDSQHPDRLPMLGGWMNAYALNSEVNTVGSNIISDKIFDITDIDMYRVQNLKAGKPHIQNFEQEFQVVHPGLRDEAITFDAGVCITDAFRILNIKTGNGDLSKNLSLTNEISREYCKLIMESHCEAVSSTIAFNSKGINSTRGLSYAIFATINNQKKWKLVGMDEILDL